MKSVLDLLTSVSVKVSMVFVLSFFCVLNWKFDCCLLVFFDGRKIINIKLCGANLIPLFMCPFSFVVRSSIFFLFLLSFHQNWIRYISTVEKDREKQRMHAQIVYLKLDLCFKISFFFFVISNNHMMVVWLFINFIQIHVFGYRFHFGVIGSVRSSACMCRCSFFD